jgi:hypothetical protein
MITSRFGRHCSRSLAKHFVLSLVHSAARMSERDVRESSATVRRGAYRGVPERAVL